MTFEETLTEFIQYSIQMAEVNGFEISENLFNEITNMTNMTR